MTSCCVLHTFGWNSAPCVNSGPSLARPLGGRVAFCAGNGGGYGSSHGGGLGGGTQYSYGVDGNGPGIVYGFLNGDGCSPSHDGNANGDGYTLFRDGKGNGVVGRMMVMYTTKWEGI